jgi:paraquat-inducible protein A
MTKAFETARHSALISCPTCRLLCRAPDLGNRFRAACPRCGEALHVRKPNSIARTWALLIAAYILYIPANVFPIMTVTSLGQTESDTILSGVLYFIESGSWLVALVIFIASIFIPLLKLLILTGLLVSIRKKSRWRPRDRTRLYRLIEGIGRWSMVDIYVVTLMVAIVKIGAIASIEAAPAVVYFAAVVILTMLAAMSFDPRLIWDNVEETNE